MSRGHYIGGHYNGVTVERLISILKGFDNVVISGFKIVFASGLTLSMGAQESKLSPESKVFK